MANDRTRTEKSALMGILPPFERRVAVTAMGVISPLGVGASETMAALRAARDCVSAIGAFDVSRCRCKTAGQVSDAWLAPHRPRGAHRASAMMIAAAGEVFALDRAFAPLL
jgi:3-oxoacyl-(acyl-carrier-protein) synthase